MLPDRTPACSPLLAAPLVALLVALLVAAAPLAAQAHADSTRPWTPRIHAGIAADYSRPTGALHQQVSGAGGVQAHLRIRLDRDGLVALRLQGGYVAYGNESQRSCVAATPGCRVAATVSTANGILSAAVGPEFSLPLGGVRTYAHGLIGLSRFTTYSTLNGGLLADLVAADENFGDGGFTWSTGAGIEVPLGTRLALDIGVAYQGHGRREYLIKGGITDNPDASLDLDVKRSTANLVAFRVGFTTALRRRTKAADARTAP